MESLLVRDSDDSIIYRTLVFMCPHCDQKLIYSNFIPVKCPYCRTGLLDYKKLLGDLSNRVYWHITGLIA
jgi:uncharacterized protein (DUF983 family)